MTAARLENWLGTDQSREVARRPTDTNPPVLPAVMIRRTGALRVAVVPPAITVRHRCQSSARR
ncbi:MAG: hypothetical protein M3381_11320 [Actinomycetota bacterium]|nr:hypothetical protein [Actinomycetota bacterium]